MLAALVTKAPTVRIIEKVNCKLDLFIRFLLCWSGFCGRSRACIHQVGCNGATRSHYIRSCVQTLVNILAILWRGPVRGHGEVEAQSRSGLPCARPVAQKHKLEILGALPVYHIPHLLQAIITTIVFLAICNYYKECSA